MALSPDPSHSKFSSAHPLLLFLTLRGMLNNILQEETKTVSRILCTAPGTFAAGFEGAKQNGCGVVGEENTRAPRMAIL